MLKKSGLYKIMSTYEQTYWPGIATRRYPKLLVISLLWVLTLTMSSHRYESFSIHKMSKFV